MRKFLLVILSVLMLACLSAFVACGGNKDAYHTLVFRQANGVRYVCDIKSGWEVKDGTTVKFRLAFDNDVEGKENAVVSIGSLSAESSTDNEGREVLTPNSSGVYSFKMKEDTEVRVDGITAKGEYNTLVFSPKPGIMYTILNEGLSNGMSVRKGTTVRFKITVGDGYEGTPEVYANSELLEKDGNGEYSFEINEPTTVRVEGVTKLITLNFNAGDAHVKYFDEDNVEIETDVNKPKYAGDVIRFKVKISVYYVQEGYEVLAGTTVLKPDNDGFYEVTIQNNTNIKVSSLKLEASFTERADGGSGESYDPYRISKPVDLMQMAMLINDDFYTDGRYFNGYYRLENDIDLDGEQLYIIGDASTNIAFFAGKFDGNGHTISNYYITDEWIDQESFETTYITNVGLFGYVTPTTISFPEIYNLHLDNFTVRANPARYPENSENNYETYVGGLIGISYGASVTGCTATNGTIVVTGNPSYPAFVGGLIGQQMSAYSSDGAFMFYSGVTSCYTDIDINISGNGYVYATGGITGLLAVGEEHVSAYILNSYTTGDINGGHNAGGIVGYASASTSVINCYSTGDVYANNPIVYNANYTTNDIYNANAGGIVGRLGFNSLIYNSFAMGEISVKSTTAPDRALKGDIVAYRDHGEDLRDITTYEPVVFGSKAVSKVTEDLIYNEFGWNREDWVFKNGMPAINTEVASLNFTVTFKADTNFGAAPSPISLSEYRNMANWYLQQNGIPEFVNGNSGMRSFSYFFDAEHQFKVPFAFIPTTDMDLYIGAADYSVVWGTYFLGDSVNSKARLILEEDGTFEYRNGALSISSRYTWDGTNLILLTTYLGELSTSPKLSGKDYRDYYLSSLYNFGATVDANTHALKITGGWVQEISITQTEDGIAYSTTGNVFNLFDEGEELIGVKMLEDFHYGEYFDSASNTKYAFYGNGTGIKIVGGNETTFTYVFAGNNSLTITYANDTTTVSASIVDNYVSTINSQSVKPYDGFTGTWEREFAINDSYYFDGKGKDGTGSWTYTSTGSNSNGTYTIDESGVLKATGNSTFEAKINEDGFIVITKDSKEYVYYANGSFVGEWYYNQSVKDGSRTVTISINLTLKGINREGYGSAVAEFGTGEIYDLGYHAEVNGDSKTIYIYNSVTKFAELTFDKTSNLLKGEVDGRKGRIAAYDNYRGIWISDNDVLETVQFNGLGFYDESGDSETRDLAVSGTVRLGNKSAGKYEIDRTSMTGTYTYNNVKYTLKYDESTGFINVTATGVTATLKPRDMWYNNPLIDDNGFVYTFDGRGNLDNKEGHITVDNGNSSDYYELKYKLNGDTITVISDDSAHPGGTISVQEVDGKKVFQFARNSSTNISLTRHTPFTGEWAIGGERGTIEIGKIYADNKAEGTYTSSEFKNGALVESEENITLTYDLEGAFMHFELDGDTYYINALTSTTATELSIGPENSIRSSLNSICIKAELKDYEYGEIIFKVYDSEKGKDTGESLIFDGLSASVFRYGTAVLYDKDCKALGGYSYTKDSFGFPRLISGNLEYYMVPWTVGEELNYNVLFFVHNGNEYYAIVQPDFLYGITVKSANETNVTYKFNGVGGVTKYVSGQEDEKYEYTIVLIDNVDYKYVLKFTDESNNVYTVTLDRKDSDKANWTVNVKVADALFEMYVRDASSQEAYFLFDGAGRVIRLSSVEAIVNYTYEVITSKADRIMLKFTTSNGTAYLATLDRSSANEEEWTISLDPWSGEVA